MLQLATQHSDDITTIWCKGRIVLGDDLHRLEVAALSQNTPEVMLDLSRVNLIDAAGLAARGASLDSQRKRLRDSQRSSLQCAHGDGATRAAATTRGVLDRAHGATPDSGAPFLRTAEPAAGGAWV